LKVFLTTLTSTLGIVSKHFCSAAQNADNFTNHRGGFPQISEFENHLKNPVLTDNHKNWRLFTLLAAHYDNKKP
jgi:hypothetical protein